MKILGKKIASLEETIEAYACNCASCNCTGCSCSCFLGINSANTDSTAKGLAENGDKEDEASYSNYSK